MQESRVPRLPRFFILAGAVLFALSACGGQNSSNTAGSDTLPAKQKSVLVINNGAEPESLDPAKTSGVPEANLERQLFEGLVLLDANGKTTPALAASWENKDFKVWTFKLRDDAK